MGKKEIYLAGSFYDFRDRIIQQLPEFNFADPRNHRQFSISSLVEDDMKDAIASPVLVACFPEKKSRGTMTYAEVGASRVNGNYIIIADENSLKDNLLERIADKNLNGIDDAINFLRENNNLLKSEFKKIKSQSELNHAETVFVSGDDKYFNEIEKTDKKIICYENLKDLSDFENVDVTFVHFPEKGDWDRKAIFFMGVSYALKIPIIMLDQKEIPYPPLSGLVRRIFRTKDSVLDYFKELKSQKISDEALIMYNLFKKYDGI